MLAEHIQGTRSGVRVRGPSLLTGKVADDQGEPLTSSYACKGKVRYHYYVGRADTQDSAIRIPAREIEAAVCERLAKAFAEPVALLASAGVHMAAPDYAQVHARGVLLAERLRKRERELVRELIDTVRVERGRILVQCLASVASGLLQVELGAAAPATIELVADVRLTRSGHSMRLVDRSGVAAERDPSTSLVRLLAQAQTFWVAILSEGITAGELAKREKLTSSYVSRVLRLNFLAPAVMEAALAGRLPEHTTGDMLTLPGSIDPSWAAQKVRWMRPA